MKPCMWRGGGREEHLFLVLFFLAGELHAPGVFHGLHKNRYSQHLSDAA